MKNVIVILFSSLLISACSTNYYSEIDESERHSSIMSATRDKLFNPPLVFILEINGLPVNINWKGYGAKRRIAIGKNNIYVTANTGGPLTGYAPIEFKAEVGKNYAVTYESRLNSIIFTLYEIETGKKISSVEVSKSPASNRGEVFIPVVL